MKVCTALYVKKNHNIKHPNNQRETFFGTPSVRFKVDALNTHSKCKLHSAAIGSEMLPLVSYFHQEVTKKREVESSVLHMVFSLAYFLMKESLQINKLLPLLDFMQKTCDVDVLRYLITDQLCVRRKYSAPLDRQKEGNY